MYVLVRAPVRFIVSGMGDAMAARPTMSSIAIAGLCEDTCKITA